MPSIQGMSFSMSRLHAHQPVKMAMATLLRLADPNES